VLNIADHTDSARDTTRPRSRRALLAAVKNPDNWHPADCRPQLRRAIDDPDLRLPLALRLWAHDLVGLLTPAGEFRLDGGLAALIAVSHASRRTTFRYLSQLERVGLIERETTTTRVGPGEFRRSTRLRAGEAFRPATQRTPLRPAIVPAGGTKAKTYSMVDVGDQPPARNARARETASEQITDQDRRAVDDGWRKCARSRLDVPAVRYGNNNATERRLAYEREHGPPEPVRFEPRPGTVLAAIFAQLNERQTSDERF